MIPLILVIAINALLTYVVFPSIDFTALTAKFPELDIKGSLGLWSIIIALDNRDYYPIGTNRG